MAHVDDLIEPCPKQIPLTARIALRPLTKAKESRQRAPRNLQDNPRASQQIRQLRSLSNPRTRKSTRVTDLHRRRRLSPSKSTSSQTVAYSSTPNILGSPLPNSEKIDPPLADFYAALRRQNGAAPLAGFATALNSNLPLCRAAPLYSRQLPRPCPPCQSAFKP